MKLNRRTTLHEIKQMVLIDFGIEISNDTAYTIRDANRRGILIWTPKHLVVSSTGTTPGLRIFPHQIP